MTTEIKLHQIRSKLLRIHYYLMDNPRFWYDKGIQEASKICCVIASDLKVEIGKTTPFRSTKKEKTWPSK